MSSKNIEVSCFLFHMEQLSIKEPVFLLCNLIKMGECVAETAIKCRTLLGRYLAHSVKAIENFMEKFEQTGPVELKRRPVCNRGSLSEENIATVQVKSMKSRRCQFYIVHSKIFI